MCFHDTEFRAGTLVEESLNKTIHEQPAITRACRLLRHEALPVFYDIAYAHTCASDAEMQGRSPNGVNSNLVRAPRRVISMWRNILIEACAYKGKLCLLECSWDIQLAKDKEPSIHCLPGRSRFNGKGKDWMGPVEARIREALQRMKTSEGNIVLTRRGITALGRVVEDALSRTR